MAESFDDSLRALIRLIPPARALKEDLEKSLHLETYAGTGDMAVRSFQGLQASVADLTNDSYVSSLGLSVAPEASDKEKVSVTLLAAGQLAAYLEGQTGLVGMSGSGGKGGGNITIQKAPTINLNNVEGIASEALSKMADMAARYNKTEGEES